MIVIADTTPLNYLVLIQLSDLLPRLFDRVLIPQAVREELRDPETPNRTPNLVRLWFANAPSCSRSARTLQVRPFRLRPDPALDFLGAGEREAVQCKLPFIWHARGLRRAAQLDLADLPATPGPQRRKR
jgi:hypothetical protein